MRLKEPKATLDSLKNELKEDIMKRNPTLKIDAAFVYWFLYTYLVAKEDVVLGALTGKEGGQGGEKNIDAIYIDDKAQQCNIIQGKLRESQTKRENHNDVLEFARLGTLPWTTDAQLNAFYKELDPIAMEKIKEVISCAKNKKYKLNLYYVTTGLCTESIIDEARQTVKYVKGNVEFKMVANHEVMHLFKEYLMDQTPHIPPLKLRISPVQHKGSINRYDHKTKIESWVFSALGYDIAEMYNKVGRRIFAKNIRGWQGPTEVNKSILETVNKEPHNFWYYNNGVTIVCDDARLEGREGEEALIIEGAQIINGQQTTISLSEGGNCAKNTSILVKVIKIPRMDTDKEKYDHIVNSIVRATNWQNHISPSDLISNDYIQIFLERELRKKYYQYIRKKMNKTEARRIYGQGYWQIDKRELAQAVAACLCDPSVLRTEGKEGLFEDPLYDKIFSSNQISFYLPKYWLMKKVRSVSSGYPQRSNAVGLVLNLAWYLLEVEIASGEGERRFRYACERRIPKVIHALEKLLTDIFRAALKFYRLNCGKGEKRKDPSTFFREVHLYQKFIRFWNSNKNYKAKMRINKFREALDKVNNIEGQ